MRKALRRLKGYTGRVLRDIERQLDKVPEGRLKARLEEMIALVNRLLAQKPKDRKKLYSLHEPAVDCISRGKATSATSLAPRSARLRPTGAAL